MFPQERERELLDSLKQSEIANVVTKGLNPNVPENYFKNNDPNENITPCWHAESVLFYQNWLAQLVKNKRKI